MIKVTDEQKKALKNHIDNLEVLIESDDVNELLLAIDDAIIANMDEDDEPDASGIELQKIYDQIYNNN
jgi:hypothetical protein